MANLDADAEIERLGWTVGKFLGEGAFGLVKLVARKSDGVTAACKIMAKPTNKEESDTIEMEYKVCPPPLPRARVVQLRLTLLPPALACGLVPDHERSQSPLHCEMLRGRSR